MEIQYSIGVDVSKEWLNFCVRDAQLAILEEGQCDNTEKAIRAYLQDLWNRLPALSTQPTVLIMEYTGLYVKPLAKTYLAMGGVVSIVAADKISEQLGGSAARRQEKTDQIDARRLAEYAHRYADQLTPWQLGNPTLDALQSLQRLRSRLLNSINSLEVPAREVDRFEDAALAQLLHDSQRESLRALKSDLERVEQRLQELIDEDQNLRQLFQWITSVEGIGPVTAREILITTNAFHDFKPDEAKSFARYAGIVPLQRQSGKRNGRARTRKGNKHLKSLLTMGATVVIRSNMKSELGDYYHRKRAEGKEHLVVINAMRNKLILRVFAVVRNQVMYQKNLNLSLAVS
jgi:transposase